MKEKVDWIENPDGSMTTSKWDGEVDERVKILRKALFEMQKRMPAGQKWSLYSWGACSQIAGELNDKLNKWEDSKRDDFDRAFPFLTPIGTHDNKMLTGQALEIVLDMARSSYSKSFGPTQREQEAIEEVEFLLKSYEDTGDYTEDDYMED